MGTDSGGTERRCLEDITTRRSFLSPPVRELLRRAAQPSSSSSSSSCWVSSDGKINWEKIEEVLAGVPGEVWGEAWYRGAVEALAPLLPQCHTLLVGEGHKGTLPALMPYLAWMGQEEGVRQCVQLLVGGKGACDHLAALLCLTALAERALGALVLIGGGQVPFLLRDLLDTPELRQIMGSPWVTVAKVLVGSVLGLNLRNLAWHGFLSPEETLPGPASTLLLLLVECGRVLEREGKREAVPRRPFVPLKLKEGVGMEVLAEEVWPSRVVVEEVIGNCRLVPKVMKHVWTRALEHLFEGRHWVGVAMLLPQLECSLRCLFAWANAVPSRVLTAQHTALYTTLDHTLAAHVETGGGGEGDGAIAAEGKGGTRAMEKEAGRQEDDDDNDRSEEELNNEDGIQDPDFRCRQGAFQRYQTTPSPPPLTTTITTTTQEEMEGSNANRVLSILGREVTEALFDLLNFSHGPRVRDRVSHGEAGFGDVTPSIANHILHLSLLVLICGEEESESGVPRHHSSSSSSCSKSCSGSSSSSTGSFASNYDFRKMCVNGVLDLETTHPHFTTKLSVETQDAIHILRKWISGYRSHFHPTSLLHEALHTSTSLLSHWRDWKRVEKSELDYVEWEEQEVEVEMLKGREDALMVVKVDEGERKKVEGNVEVRVEAKLSDKLKDTQKIDEMEEKEESKRIEYNTQLENKGELKEDIVKPQNKCLEEKTMIRAKIIGRISFFALPSTHTILTLSETPLFLTQINLLHYHVLHRPRSELEVVSAMRRITANTQAALRNIQDSLRLNHSQFTTKKMRSRRRETYKRQLNAVPTVIWGCFLTLQTVYMLFLSLHSVPDLSKDSFSRLLRLLKGVLKAMENVASQTDPQTNRWDEAACVSRENVTFILRNLWRP